jgi:hypothetical protein
MAVLEHFREKSSPSRTRAWNASLRPNLRRIKDGGEIWLIDKRTFIMRSFTSSSSDPRYIRDGSNQTEDGALLI